MLPRPEPSLWWTFLPMFGLIIHDDSDSLQRPLFGDVTLVTDVTLRHVLEIGRTHAPLGPIALTQLAVRRRAIVNTQWFDEERQNDVFLHEVRRRATQVSAFLTIAFLAMSEEGLLCGLQEENTIVERHFGLYHPGGQDGFMSWGSGPSIDTFDYILPNPPTMTLTELDAFFQQRLIGPLVPIISEGKTPLAKTWRKTIRQVCVRLASAIHAQSYIHQVFGAITSIEMLLSSDDSTSTFTEIQQRLMTLLGPGCAERYAAPRVFQARHNYVHRGEDIFNRELPVQAIGLAVAALCRYAQLAPLFLQKANLLAYLDLTRTAQRLQAPWIHDSIALVPAAQQILAQPMDMPLFRYIDAVLAFDVAYHAGEFDRFDRIFEDPDAGES